MLRVGKQTRQAPDAILKKAQEFFGPGGVGLVLRRVGDNSVRFEGGDGFVEVTAETTAGETDINIITREWEYDVRRFLAAI